MSLRFKLFSAFVVFIIIPLFVLGIAAYVFISDMIEKKYSQQTELTLRALSENVNFILREMNKVTDSTIASKALQELWTKREYADSDLSRADYFLELNQIQRDFRDLLINHPSVSYAFMYTFKEDRFIPIYSKTSFTALPFEDFRRQPIYREVMERAGEPKWVGPYEYPDLTGYDPVFTQIRVVKDIATLKDQGILLVQVKNSGLESLFRYYRFNQEKYDARFFIVNDAGLVLFDSNDDLNGQNLNRYTNGLPLDGRYHSKRSSFSGEDSVISGMSLGNENWHLVSVTSWSSLSTEIMQYARWVAVISGALVVLALVFLLFFVNRIVRTIIRTVRFMRRVENGELHIRIDESGNDELRLLGRGLNSLIERVSELLGRVKQEQEQKNRAEMLVLQAQIKPHFLFNTLESINVLAVQNEGKKVSQMVLRLANILRISFQGKEEIPLRQEVEHLQSYLEIQKFRFTDLFEYEIDVPEALMNCHIQKLTLQPLVENCIQHGFDGIRHTGLIRIRAEAAAGRLILTVEDNGVGIPNEALANFQYLSRDEASPLDGRRETREPERRGLGVRSVADRIRIQYGKEYGLFICSSPEGGTMIKCVIPKYESGGRA